MLPVISWSLTVFLLFAHSSCASRSSCTNLCPDLFNRDKCCDDFFHIPTLRPNRHAEREREQEIIVQNVFIGIASVVGVMFLICVICAFCPCCVVYKRRKNGTIYRRFGSDHTSGRKKKAAPEPYTTVSTTNQTPTVTFITSHPVQMNVPQPCVPGQMMGPTAYNHPPQPQGMPFPTPMHAPPPCTVAVVCDPPHTQPAYNPMYRQ